MKRAQIDGAGKATEIVADQRGRGLAEGGDQGGSAWAAQGLRCSVNIRWSCWVVAGEMLASIKHEKSDIIRYFIF